MPLHAMMMMVMVMAAPDTASRVRRWTTRKSLPRHAWLRCTWGISSCMRAVACAVLWAQCALLVAPWWSRVGVPALLSWLQSGDLPPSLRWRHGSSRPQ